MKTFSLRNVAKLVTDAGFPAYVEMTGGNCGTIYVGDVNAEGYYTTACGVGSYADDLGYYEEFYIGRDGDEQEDGFYFHDYNPIWSEESVAKAIVHAHKVFLSKESKWDRKINDEVGA